MKLIDADALMKFPIRIDRYDKEHGNEHFVLGIESVLEYAEHLPTVDADPVIRCKDCKHYREDSFWCNMNSRDRNEWFNWYPEDFCSYGERRTDVQVTD